MSESPNPTCSWIGRPCWTAAHGRCRPAPGPPAATCRPAGPRSSHAPAAAATSSRAGGRGRGRADPVGGHRLHPDGAGAGERAVQRGTERRGEFGALHAAGRHRLGQRLEPDDLVADPTAHRGEFPRPSRPPAEAGVDAKSPVPAADSSRRVTLWLPAPPGGPRSRRAVRAPVGRHWRAKPPDGDPDGRVEFVTPSGGGPPSTAPRIVPVEPQPRRGSGGRSGQGVDPSRQVVMGVQCGAHRSLGDPAQLRRRLRRGVPEPGRLPLPDGDHGLGAERGPRAG